MNDDRKLFQSLDELARIQPDADATRRVIEETRQAVTDIHESWYTVYGRKLMSRRNIAAALVALAAIAVLSHWLLPTGSTAAFGFAEVQEQVKKARSVQYTETRVDRTKDGRSPPKSTKRVLILGSHLQREEVSVTGGDELPQGHTWGVRLGKYVNITDAKRGRVVVLYPKEKEFTVIRGTLWADDDGDVKESDIRPFPEVDYYERIRQIPAETAKKLPERTIDGKDAIGFVIHEVVERKRGTDSWTRTYWVDPRTKLPLRVEVSSRSTNPMMGESDWVQSDFVFDAPLDESLFSTVPPPGFTDASEKQADKPAK